MSVLSPWVPLIVALDVIMLAFVGLQGIWRQRVVQLVVVAICTTCFAILFFSTALQLADSYYPRFSLTLLTISLYLTTAGSGAALIYLIIAITRTGRRRYPPPYASAGYSPPPLPPMTDGTHLGPPPVPGRRAEASRMPLGVSIAIVFVFAASVVFKLYGQTLPRSHFTVSIFISFVIDLIMIAVGIWHAKWPYRKVEFSIVLVATLFLAYFLLTALMVVTIRYNMVRYGTGLPMTFYLYPLLSVARLAIAVTALVYCIRAAFGSQSATMPIAPPPNVPVSRPS